MANIKCCHWIITIFIFTFGIFFIFISLLLYLVWKESYYFNFVVEIFLSCLSFDEFCYWLIWKCCIFENKEGRSLLRLLLTHSQNFFSIINKVKLHVILCVNFNPSLAYWGDAIPGSIFKVGTYIDFVPFIDSSVTQIRNV